MNNLNWALYYTTKCSWSVIPVGANGKDGKLSKKAPFLSSWKEYQNRLPTEEEITEWWTNWPDAKIAVLTGKVSNLIVVDVDKPQTFLNANINFPDTLKVKTGKGIHYYFKYPDTPFAKQVMEWGEIQSDGNYVIAPPSDHHDAYGSKDGQYEWVDNQPGEIELSVFNPSLLSFKENNNQHKGFINSITGITAGTRNNSAASFIGGLLMKMNAQKAWEATVAWNMALTPPLETEELQSVFNSIFKKENSKNSKEKREYTIKTNSELLELKVKEKPFIIQDIVPENTITAIVADTGKGKSIFALIMAKHIASGEDFKGLSVKKSNVLIIDQEMDEDIIVGRYQSIISDHNIVIDYLYEQFWSIDNEDDYKWLRDEIIRRDYKVIFFDTLSMIHTKNENDNGEMKEINKLMLQLIKDTGCTIIILHHNRKLIKGEKASHTTARGASEIISKAASQLILDSSYDVEGNNGITEMIIEQAKRRRPSAISKLAIDVSYNFDTKNTSWNFKDINDNLVAIVEAKTAIINILSNDNSGIGVKHFVDNINISEKNIRDALKQLEDNGVINKKKRGKPFVYFINQEYNTSPIEHLPTDDLDALAIEGDTIGMAF